MTTAKEILEKKGGFVAAVKCKSTVLEATKEMNERRIGSVVVCDQDKVVGIFTERDILTRVVAAQRDPAATTMDQVMTAPIACCTPETSLEELKSVMTEKRIRHIPVVEEDELKGIITIGDILAQEKAKRIETIKYLKEYIYGPYIPPE